MTTVNAPHLLGKLDLVLRRARRELESNVSPVQGLRRSDYRLLDFTPSGGTRPSDLANGASVSKQAIAEFVARLQHAGLVDVAPDPIDGRARLVTPTQEGLRIQDEIRRTVTALEQEVEGRVGAQRWHAFCEVLDALADPPPPRSPTASTST